MKTQGPRGHDVEDLAKAAFSAGLEVHRQLGPGLLESAYEACLLHELAARNLVTKSQISLPIVYKGLRVEQAYKIDILVEQTLVLELKAVEELHPKHRAQLNTYLKLGNYHLGLLMNFNESLFKDGVQRVINGYR